jgi:hypothetical protein
MEPAIRTGSMAAVDRGDREIRKNKPYAIRAEWGLYNKILAKGRGYINNDAKEPGPASLSRPDS